MKTSLGIVAALAFGANALAQDANIVGTYTGTYSTSQNTTIQIRLKIASVENGIVKGSAYRSSTARSGGVCAGEYPMEGTLNGNELDVRGKATQRDGDCTLRLRAVVAGDRLEAKFGGNSFTMTR